MQIMSAQMHLTQRATPPDMPAADVETLWQLIRTHSVFQQLTGGYCMRSSSTLGPAGGPIARTSLRNRSARLRNYMSSLATNFRARTLHILGLSMHCRRSLPSGPLLLMPSQQLLQRCTACCDTASPAPS